MTTIEKHNQQIEDRNYTGVVTDFNGYVQFGTISDREDHNTIGYTVDAIKKFVEIINTPGFLYSRCKGTYINIYCRNDESPTGVLLVGGIPTELEFLLYAFGKSGSLSPTEGLQSAR